ncbi:MAG TPA: phospholipase D family protein [Bacteroidia bacterium]|nr:phospholipase D family protein [Bacteroidia bacterium]
MLHPKNNRIDYGEQLIPPAGYELAYAIGTTYSLDLEALMMLPVALFYSQTLEGNVEKLRYDMLDAITKASDKITVYYQNGSLKPPKKYHFLMSYWEKGIEPITMPSHLNSFHPKVWVIRYERKECPPKYRVLVTSRNLTFARDWDIAFSTEGELTDNEQQKNKPLLHFLQYLNGNGKRKWPPSFLTDLMKVKFDLPDKFESISFVPIGIKDINFGKQYINPIISKNSWDELLVISPFVDKKTLDAISEKTVRKFHLLSRKEELDGVTEETLDKFNCWQFSKFIQQAEHMQALEEDGVIPLDQNLHAKLFVGMIDKVSHWYLGSANCSDPAQSRNVEFMIHLKGNNIKGIRTTDLFDALTNTTQNDNLALFEKYDFDNRRSVEEQKQIDLDIRKIRYDISSLPMKGNVELIQGGTAYNLMIEIDASKLTLPEGFKVKLKPLPEIQKSARLLICGQLNTINEFTGYAETFLSPFLLFEISKDELDCSRFLVRMEIELPATRLNKIFTSIIDNKEKFLEYLNFLLTGDDTDVIGNNSTGKLKNVGLNDSNVFLSEAPIYEKLLIAASRYPDKLKSIDTLISKLKEESAEFKEPIVTPEFENFWEVFRTFVQNKS